MKKIMLRISGMHCTSCAINIDGELEDTEGVRKASTNYAKQQAEIVFDHNTVSIDEIIKIIEKIGYKAQTSEKEVN